MPLNIIIVGGVAGGASAAAKARRTNETANIVMFEKGPMYPLPTVASRTMWEKPFGIVMTFCFKPRSGSGNDSGSGSTCYTKSFS